MTVDRRRAPRIPSGCMLKPFGDELRRARGGSDGRFDLVVEVPMGADVRAPEAADARWVLTSIDPQLLQPEVGAVVDAGP